MNNRFIHETMSGYSRLNTSFQNVLCCTKDKWEGEIKCKIFSENCNHPVLLLADNVSLLLVFFVLYNTEDVDFWSRKLNSVGHNLFFFLWKILHTISSRNSVINDHRHWVFKAWMKLSSKALFSTLLKPVFHVHHSYQHTNVLIGSLKCLEPASPDRGYPFESGPFI